MSEKLCCKCNKLKNSTIFSEAIKNYICNPCYRRYLWKPKIVNCKRCSRELPMHAKGLCKGCYNSVFHIDKVKASNTKKYHNISQELYQKITQKCVVCGFNKIVDLHHLDFNHNNNAELNLIGLCPNHHKMLHNRKYQKEIFKNLEEKGFKMPKSYENDDKFK